MSVHGSVLQDAWSPGQHPTLQNTDDLISAKPEDGVDDQAHEYDVGAQEVAGGHDQEADAAIRIDLFGDHQAEPGNTEGIAQADERRWQGPGQNDVTHLLASAQIERTSRFHQFG